MKDSPRKYRHWSAAEIKRMIALYAGEGFSLSEVGAEFGLSPTRIRRIFAQNEVPLRKRTNSRKLYASFEKKRTILDRETLQKLYTGEGLSLEKIAEQLGTSYAVVERNFKAYGIGRRAPGRHTPATLPRELLERLYLRERLTVPQIADRLALAEGSIRKKLYNFGIRKKDLKAPPETENALVPMSTINKVSDQKNININENESISDKDIEAENNKKVFENSRKKKVGQKDRKNNESSDGIENSPVWLSVAEAAVRLKRQPSFIRRKLREGFFPNAFRQTGKKSQPWVIPAADLAEFELLPVGRKRLTDPPPSTVLSRLPAARTKIRRLRGYGKPEILQMVELEKAGWSAAEIAVRFRLPDLLIEDILAAVAVKPLRTGKPRPAKRPLKRLPKDLLIELYVEKKIKTAEILERLSTNYRSLYINLRYYGIPLRSQRFK